MPYIKYLENYSELKNIKHFSPVEGNFDCGVAIPCRGEFENIPKLLASLEKAAAYSKKKIFCLFVVNDCSTASAYATANQNLFSYLQNYSGENITALPLNFFEGENLFPEKGGVGLARKVGCDILLNAIFNKHISTPYIYTTDGDAEVSQNYFDLPQREFSLGICDYAHEGPADEILEATRIYEQTLLYYKEGLRAAGSPYAFDTIGSTYIIDAKSYAQVRGFPKRDAGEDFYLFNKLAKVGPVRCLPQKVTLRARTSDRVPFGTGAGVKKILDRLRADQSIETYHPNCFLSLRILLQNFALPENELENAFQQRFSGDQIKTLMKLLQNQDYFLQIEKAKQQHKNCDSLQKFFDDFFDAFKTLRWIHRTRDQLFGTVSYRAALDGLPQLLEIT